MKPVYPLQELKEKTESFDIKHILKDHAYQNIPLDFEEAYQLGLYTLFPYREELSDLFEDEEFKKGKITKQEKKDLAKKQSLAALCTLHNKATYESEHSAEQIAGICAVGIFYGGVYPPLWFPGLSKLAAFHRFHSKISSSSIWTKFDRTVIAEIFGFYIFCYGEKR